MKRKRTRFSRIRQNMRYVRLPIIAALYVVLKLARILLVTVCPGPGIWCTFEQAEELLISALLGVVIWLVWTGRL